MRIITRIILILTLGATPALSDDTITVSDEITLLGLYPWETLLGYTARVKIPFLRGAMPLTEGNNITLKFNTAITPVSINASADAVWTPVALLELSAGGAAGSGWNIVFFGSDCYGIGINKADADGAAVTDGSAFDGILWRLRAGGALQFDLGAVFPGDWNHVVARTYHEINRKEYTRASARDSWYFEDDDGENVNGFNYHGSFLIGYRMPAFIDFAALLAEADLHLHNTPNREQWRDDKIRWTLSALANIPVIPDRLDVTLITQFRTRRNYVNDGTNWETIYYRDRQVDANNPVRAEFWRVIAAVTYKGFWFGGR